MRFNVTCTTNYGQGPSVTGIMVFKVNGTFTG
jgi:hypothetical protein